MFKLSANIFNKYSTGKKDYINGKDYSIYSINLYDLNKIIDEINKDILKETERDIAELEAKVYTYETIIANSNFKPILKEPKLTIKRGKEDES